MPIVFSSGSITAPTKILQVQETVISSPYTNSNSNNSWVAASGFSRSITTLGTSSKILVTVNLGYAKPQGNTMGFKFQRNGTDVAIANSNGSRQRMMFRTTDQGTDGNHAHNSAFSFIDSPVAPVGTSLTYQLYFMHEGSGTVYINRNVGYLDNTGAEYGVTISTIQVMEIAA